MKITAVETIRSSEQSNVCFVRLHTDEGLTGLGESFYGASTVETQIHDQLLGDLFGLEELTPNEALRVMRPYVGYQGGGAETRAMGAIDIALWDLMGKRAGLPLWQLLGGLSRSSIMTYNTCAGTRYVSNSNRQESGNWGLDVAGEAPYEDLIGFLTRPAELTRELLASGYSAMKIWPFDKAAERNGGVDISRAELEAGLDIVRRVRDEAGDGMEILIELHGLWLPRGAIKIAEALEPLSPYWIEDPIRPDAVDALKSLHDHTSIPVATGETTVGRRGFLPLLNEGVVDIVTMDIGWTGGITEAVKVATLADTFGIPIAPHDCTGPVTLSVATHVACSQPNGLIQESARAFLHTWYGELAEGFPVATAGELTPSSAPGHGVALHPDILTKDHITSRLSSRS